MTILLRHRLCQSSVCLEQGAKEDRHFQECGAALQVFTLSFWEDTQDVTWDLWVESGEETEAVGGGGMEEGTPVGEFLRNLDPSW